jgi:hypothetical protein
MLIPAKRKVRSSNTAVEDLSAEEPPQKRKKYDNRPEPSDVVDEMERLMGGINSSLAEYVMVPPLSETPQDLLKRGVSADTVTAELETFKKVCQIRLRQISIRRSMGSPSNLTPAQNLDEGRFIL